MSRWREADAGEEPGDGKDWLDRWGVDRHGPDTRTAGHGPIAPPVGGGCALDVRHPIHEVGTRSRGGGGDATRNCCRHPAPLSRHPIHELVGRRRGGAKRNCHWALRCHPIGEEAERALFLAFPFASHRIASHHIALHHITSHYMTFHCIA